MTRKDLDRIDFDDWSYAGEVSDAIARAIGWRASDADRDEYVEGESGAETGYFAHSAQAFQRFDPFEDIQCALLAAARMAKARRAAFELGCSPDGNWRASFRVGGAAGDVAGFNRMPSRATCEAILKLAKRPDPQALFRR